MSVNLLAIYLIAFNKPMVDNKGLSLVAQHLAMFNEPKPHYLLCV
jgi:hypothetical protein